MSYLAIRVDNLSKLYHIGKAQRRHDTLRDAIVDAFKRWNVRTLERSDDTLWALKDVSFEVKQGEAVGIIGRNGSGKSTLLKILSRITAPTEGQIEIRGRVGSLLEVGTGFHPELTGRENIHLNGAILGMKRVDVDRKFDEIVAFAEIEKFLDTPVKRYSSGMYVRLAFAVAAHLEPDILVVDEVLAVGDAQFQKKCLGKMGDVTKGGRTVLFVSHNMAAVRKLCSHAILFYNGREIMRGPTDPVISKYLSESASEMSPVVALPPSSPNALGRGTYLRFFTQNGTPQTQFRLGEPFRIELEFEINKPLKHVMAAVGIKTIDNVQIITWWSQPEDLTIGRYIVDFECALPICSGDIHFNLGLSSEEKTFYYVETAGRVSISEVSMGSQPVRSSGTGVLSSFGRSVIRSSI